MNAHELLTYPAEPHPLVTSVPRVEESAPLSAVLEAMTLSGSPALNVTGPQNESPLTAWQVLQALSVLLPHSDEYSELMVRTDTRSYSASALARAVEDTEASLISMLAYPAGDGDINVYLRINRADPSHAVRSLERYGYFVAYAHGAENSQAELTADGILELQHYLNI